MGKRRGGAARGKVGEAQGTFEPWTLDLDSARGGGGDSLDWRGFPLFVSTSTHTCRYQSITN